MSAPDYPYWAGRLSAALEMMLQENVSPTLAEIDRSLAVETLTEYQRVTRTPAHFAALAAESAEVGK